MNLYPPILDSAVTDEMARPPESWFTVVLVEKGASCERLQGLLNNNGILVCDLRFAICDIFVYKGASLEGSWGIYVGNAFALVGLVFLSMLDLLG